MFMSSYMTVLLGKDFGYGFERKNRRDMERGSWCK